MVVLILTWVNRRDLQDWWALRDYTPTNEVVELATDTTMTDGARRIFYVNNPVIVDEIEFNSACRPESTIVLGCFILNDGIYLFDIEDERLEGIKQVTAAHELLHAMYERLSDEDRSRVDQLTQQALETVTEQRIIDTVEEYKKRDANVVPNELHSILATEVRQLPEELESYYKKIFYNRQKIVNYSEDYELEFSARKDQVNQLDQQLAQLKLQIDASQNDLALQYNALTNSKQELDSLLNAGLIEQYNNLVPGFNQQVSSYNQLVKGVDDQINQYNALVKDRNNLALEVQELVESIDSRPQNF